MMSPPVPARLHVLMARDALTGVVIRRGPSKHFGLFGWDRKSDQIRLGQWMIGRIYERRSDLSPDGKHMIYFAMNGRWSDPVSKGSWTAISRTPYLKAVTFIPWGDCWQGGGLFLDNTRYWLNSWRGKRMEKVSEDQSVIEDVDYDPGPLRNSECIGVYFPRLLRDGWYEVTDDAAFDAQALRSHGVFEKPLLYGWVLRKHAGVGDQSENQSVYWDTHTLISPDGDEFTRPRWEWAELDRRSIVYAEAGRLWRQKILNGKELAEPNLVYDFNPETFVRQQAPY